MKKNSCTPINPKKYSCKGLKKIHTRNLITKKIPAARKFPSPPITFLMVRPLQCGSLKPFNVAAYIKTERIFEKDKTETTKTAATTVVYQSAVRLLLLCSESVFLSQQTLSVNTVATLSNQACICTIQGLACCRQCLLSRNL